MKYDAALDRPRADRGSYYDTNGKSGTTEEELLGFLRNIYYVLLTRGIESTHVYVCDSRLRDYFSRFFVEDL